MVTDRMKLPAIISFRYETKVSGRHALTKCLNDDKTHRDMNSKFFEKIDHVYLQLHEVEPVEI